ncbi:MAG TPA: amidohydrolase family protein [Planctomycetota bacterium]|nr:amidohydrolase family protein [Planctomycetota bacterium]
MRTPIIPAAALAALLLAAGAAPAEEDLLAIKARRVLPVSGPPIDDGVVLVRGGRIEAVGKLEVPPLARVIDAGDGWVCPGFVEAHAQTGLDRGNEQVPLVPFVSALDALDPSHPGVEDALRDGVTTLLVIPGNATQVGGQGILVRPRGRTVEEMLLRRGAALKLSLEPVRGTTRAGQVAALRKAFREAVEWREQREKRRAEAAAAPGGVPPGDDARRQGLLDLLEKRIPAVVYAPLALDCRNGFSLADDLGFRARFVLGEDCWRAADLLKARQDAAGAGEVLFALDPSIEALDRDEDRDEERVREVAGILHRAGVRFALTTDDGPGPQRHPWYQAAVAVRQGVPRDEALRAVTLNAARFAGCDDRVGSLEPGKDANLLVLTGDPLSAGTWVDKVILEGEVSYDRKTDRKLKRLLEGEAPPTGVPAPAEGGK